MRALGLHYFFVADGQIHGCDLVASSLTKESLRWFLPRPQWTFPFQDGASRLPSLCFSASRALESSLGLLVRAL